MNTNLKSAEPAHLPPSGRLLKPGLYGLNDIDVGDYFLTEGVTVTESHVGNFAGVSGDHYSIHVDDEAARQAGFPMRIAHGLLGLSLADGLKTRCPILLKGLATLGWSWSVVAPHMIGNRMYVRVVILAKRLTKNPERGIGTMRLTILNQRGETVQDGETKMLMPTSVA